MWSRQPRRSAIADLRDRDLVRLYWPAELRPVFDALFAIDDALAEVVFSSTQPALGAIRLAWWREALERLDKAPPPPEPRLQAAASELLPRGINGQALAELEDGWAALLDEQPGPDRAGNGGVRLFVIATRLLGTNDELIASAGRLFAVERIRRLRLASMTPPADEIRALAGHRFARQLRPLTGLARLAARDAAQAPNVEPEATPGRALALLFHRLSGIVT
jgi:15-cis-phytoene synthase